MTPDLDPTAPPHARLIQWPEAASVLLGLDLPGLVDLERLFDWVERRAGPDQ